MALAFVIAAGVLALAGVAQAIRLAVLSTDRRPLHFVIGAAVLLAAFSWIVSHIAIGE